MRGDLIMNNYLQRYAELVVKIGANVHKGQRVIIYSPVDTATFARMLAEESYKAGACEVIVAWNDEAIKKMKFLQGDDAIFDSFPEWEAKRYNDYADEEAAHIFVRSADPELLKDAAPDRIKRDNQALGNAIKFAKEKQLSFQYAWCIAAIPTAAWAKKVFPNVSEAEALEKLWNAIYQTVRIGEGDAVSAWENHLDMLAKRTKVLNDYDFQKLHYTSSNGTDLWVELPENHKWMSGGATCNLGHRFVANMPTEEIFTLPKKDGINGKVVASKPLVLKSGNIIEGFYFEIKDGKIVGVDAKSGLEHLQNSITIDEGASYFGEVALVPYDSPIQNSGILFYDTLFDENAACHLAYGNAIDTFKDNVSKEVKLARGMNESITHVDFMVGTKDLSIVGFTADGKEINVFKNGNFTF